MAAPIATLLLLLLATIASASGDVDTTRDREWSGRAWKREEWGLEESPPKGSGRFAK